MVNVSYLTKCISLNNQPSRPTLFGLSLDECILRSWYNPFLVNLDRYSWSSNTLDDPYGWICVSNKTEDANLSVLI